MKKCVLLVTEGTREGQHAPMTIRYFHPFVRRLPKEPESVGFHVTRKSVGCKLAYSFGDSAPNEF